MNLYGKIVKLRPVEPEDQALLHEMINDPELEKSTMGWAFPVSMKEQEEWYGNFSSNEKCIRWMVETKEDGTVGMVSLINIDWKNGSVEFGGLKLVRKGVMSKGIATDTCMTLLRFIFCELRLHRALIAALTDNPASMRVFEKSGFRTEGVQREAVFKDGKYHDVLFASILDSEYEAFAARTKYWD